MIREYHELCEPPGSMGESPELHAAIHTVVENQLAADDPARVRATLQRLQDEGLDRHDAIRAIGHVTIQAMHDATRGAGFDEAAYVAALDKLTAKASLAIRR